MFNQSAMKLANHAVRPEAFVTQPVRHGLNEESGRQRRFRNYG